jgi:hypothetical protein
MTHLVDIDARQQLELLGYSHTERIYLADFVGKPAEHFPKIAPKRWDVGFDELDKLEQHPHKGLYIVVNGQGHKDVDIEYARAIFIEHDLKDGLTKDEQKVLWQKLNLPEPTFQVETRNSIHQYWVFSEKVSIEDWKVLINDLIIYTGADKANKNPSRVLRLAGSLHIGKDEQGNDLEKFTNKIIARAGHQYTFEKIRQSVPKANLEKSARPQTPTSPKKDSRGIPLEQLCSVIHRDIILRGVTSGSRNTTLTALIRDLLGCENWCRNSGIEYTGSARALLEEANSKCTPSPLSDREIDTIWNSALKNNPSPCLSEDKLINCLEAFQNPKKYNLPAPDNTNPKQERNHWEAPSSHNGELGEWKFKKLPKKVVQNGIEVFALDGNGDIITEEQKIFIPKADFDFQVLDYLEDDNGGGYKLRLKQTDNIAKDILLRSLDTSVPKDFITALKKAYKSDLICTLKGEEIGALLHVRLQEYYDNGGKRHILAPCRGRQKNGYWVFEKLQFDSKGNIVTSAESGVVWNPSYGDGDAIPNPNVAKPNAEILGKVLRTAKAVVGENKFFFPTLFVVAAQVMGLFYDDIFKHNGWFPLVNATGDAASGKTNSTRISQALVGLHEIGGVSSTSKSMMYESLSKVSGLSMSIDDPAKDTELEEVFKGLFNGLARTVRGNTQIPQSSLIITSNHPLGEHSSAITSRFIHIPFFRAPNIDQEKRSELIDLLPEASGAFSQLLSIRYDHKRVRELARELASSLATADSRSPETLSVLTYYALALAPYANISEKEVKDYVINTLCKTASQSIVNQDSLRDFVDKLQQLQSESLIGDWDCRIIQSRPVNGKESSRQMAVIIDSVWPHLMHKYKVVYGKGTIKELVGKAGGNPKSKQRFACSKNAWLKWEAQKSDPNNSLKEPERVPRNCILIPGEYLGNDLPPDDGFLIEVEETIDKFKAEIESQIIDPVVVIPIPDENIKTTVIEETKPVYTFKIGDKVRIIGGNPENIRTVVEIDGASLILQKQDGETFKYAAKGLELVIQDAITVEPIKNAVIEQSLTSNNATKTLQEVTKEILNIVFKDDYENFTQWFRSSPENYEIFLKAWDATPNQNKLKIIALDKNKISKIENFPNFKIPEWCSLPAGSLVVHQAKLFWFVGIAEDRDLTAKEKNKGNYLIVQEITNKLQRKANIQEVDMWNEFHSVNTA